MKKTTTRGRLLASTMICGALALMAASPALAQDETPPTTTEPTEVEGIVVTGSRLAQPNLESVSPIQTVTSQEVALGGRPQTIDILNQLPQVTQNPGVDLGPTSDPLSGPGGVATVDLRGLGPQRTLVLVDGRRLGVGDPNTGNPNPAPDINQIPSQLIERVEVLTGGASATYGSDAIGGVVNFIMKDDFEGIEVDGQFGMYQHGQQNGLMQRTLRDGGYTPPGDAWDGRSYDLSVIMGANSPDDRGNLTGFFTYSKQNPVRQGARDYSACQLDTDANWNAVCSGSSNSNVFYFASGNASGSLLDLYIGDPADGIRGQDGIPDSPGGVLGSDFVEWGTPGTIPPQIFNSNPYMYLLQENTRYTAGYFAHYEVNEHLEAYSSFNFMQSESNVNIAPSALFQGSGATSTGGFYVNCDNPFLSAEQQAALAYKCNPPAGDPDGEGPLVEEQPVLLNGHRVVDMYIGRRNIEGGPRNSFYDHTNYRFVFGLRGDIVGSWRYDIYGSYYKTTLNSRVENYLSLARIQDALLVGGTAEDPVCLSGNAGCVPYNIFQTGGVSPETASTLTILGTQSGTTTQRIVEATITGDLGDYGIKSPWANDGVGVAIGLSQRRDHLRFAPDAASESGDLSGAGGASVRINNGLRAAEAFAEARVPLINDMPFARDLVLELGYRYSDYSIGIQANTYKVGFQWEPVEDIRFRGSYNQAIRAPNILELYTPQSVTNTSDVPEDPCAIGATSPATAAQCANTGADQFAAIPQCPANQCAVLTGGSTNLKEETAKTFTVGFTTQPRWLPGFTASVDYFDIKIEDVIGQIPLDIILTRCLETGAEAFCSQVVRNPVNGILFGTTVGAGGYINGTSVNVAESRNKGWDFQANYNLPMEDWGIDRYGGVSLNFAGSLLTEASTVPLPGDPSYDCAGYFGAVCATIYPEWRHTARVNWRMPWVDATISAAWRYWGETKFENLSSDAALHGDPDGFISKIDGISYFDLSGLWNATDNFSVRAGINNIFDEDPPLVPSYIVGGGLPNTYPMYDLLGRRLFLGVTARF